MEVNQISILKSFLIRYSFSLRTACYKSFIVQSKQKFIGSLTIDRSSRGFRVSCGCLDTWCPQPTQPRAAIGRSLEIHAYFIHCLHATQRGSIEGGLEASGLVRMCRIAMRDKTSRMLRGTKGSGRSKQESGTVVEFQVLKEITKLIKTERLAPRKQPLIPIF